ncbi:MAG: hypothetical protein PF483_11705 [Halothiobacillus sp.]|jgi:hypothetical protein|nr:hypothetical protein [Halothiobacillus sp.]
MKRSEFDDLGDAGVLIFGDLDFRGKCPSENREQVTFFNRLRRDHSGTIGSVALHPRNEGLKRAGQFSAVSMHRAEGMTAGASDIIIPARVTFVCELKRRDYTQCAWQDGQMGYLKAAAGLGAFACVAFGVDAAWQALEYWMRANAL